MAMQTSKSAFVLEAGHTFACIRPSDGSTLWLTAHVFATVRSADCWEQRHALLGGSDQPDSVSWIAGQPACASSLMPGSLGCWWSHRSPSRWFSTAWQWERRSRALYHA